MASMPCSTGPRSVFFRTFVLIQNGEHDVNFDIKHKGIIPITDIARPLAPAESAPEVNTTDRLQALARSRSLGSCTLRACLHSSPDLPAAEEKPGAY